MVHTKSSPQLAKNHPLHEQPRESSSSQYSRLSRSIVRISDDLAFPFVSVNRETGGWFSRGVALSTQQRVENPTLTAVASPVLVTLDEWIVSRIDPIWSSVEPNSRGTSIVACIEDCESCEERVRERVVGRKILENASEQFEGSETTEPAWLSTDFGIGEWFAVRFLVRRFSAPRVRIRASRGRRFLSVHAAHGAPSFAPTQPPFSSPPLPPPFHLFKTLSFSFSVLSSLCVSSVSLAVSCRR